MTSSRSAFTQYADLFSEVLSGARQSWNHPTPCEGWSVSAVVDHVIDTQRNFLSCHKIEMPALTDGDPRERWERHRGDLDEALADDTLWEIEYDGHFGRTTIGATLADFYGWDLVVHGWDIARATGQDWQPDDALVSELNAVADSWGPTLHMEGICAPELPVAAEASVQDRLLARLGRDPRWSPNG